MTETKLLTDTEVASILRCTPRGVARLRRLGRLPFIPGRPPTVDNADLLVYIESVKSRKLPDPDVVDPEAAMERARVRARQAWLRRRGMKS